MAWKDRPKADRFMFIGAFVGMAIAAPVAILYTSESSIFMRYLIMSAGLLAGMGAGRVIGSL